MAISVFIAPKTVSRIVSTKYSVAFVRFTNAIFLNFTRTIMKLSTNVRYAIRLLFELQKAGHPVSLSTLSDKTGITLRAMENAHTILKQQGVTDSSVGAKGGIHLTRPLEEISLGELVTWFDDGVEFSVCCGDKANDCPHQAICETSCTWREVSSHVLGVLNTISLQSVLLPCQYKSKIPS